MVIEIDFDVQKAITALRETEEVTPNDVLRSIFKLPQKKANSPQPQEGWSCGGAFFPNGTEFRAESSGTAYYLNVANGALTDGKTKYRSPSEASLDKLGYARNGWLWWEARLPGQQDWLLIDSFRKQH